MINSLLDATADSNCIYNSCCFIYTLNACYYNAFRKFACYQINAQLKCLQRSSRQ